MIGAASKRNTGILQNASLDRKYVNWNILLHFKRKVILIIINFALI